MAILPATALCTGMRPDTHADWPRIRPQPPRTTRTRPTHTPVDINNTSAEPTTTVRHTGSASAGAIPLRHNGAHQRAGSDHAAVAILRSLGDTAAFQTPMEASAGIFDEGDAVPIRLADQRFRGSPCRCNRPSCCSTIVRALSPAAYSVRSLNSMRFSITTGPSSMLAASPRTVHCWGDGHERILLSGSTDDGRCRGEQGGEGSADGGSGGIRGEALMTAEYVPGLP